MLSLLLLMLVLAQPDDPAKTIPGGPGTDGAGGDRPQNAPPTPSAPEPPTAGAPALLAAVAVPPPHPIITEVLYAVPPGDAGDANKDGKREVAGDEFVELVNPHDKPIQLFGYTLTDSQDPGKGQLKFTFPACELPPGGVVVVFNGLGSTFAPPVGDSRAPPPGPSDAFGGAWVFTMKNTSSRNALGNGGDQVLLTAPDGTPVQRVWWNEELSAGSEPSRPGGESSAPGSAPPGGPGKAKAPLLDDYAPALQRTSVQRDSVLGSGRFTSHMETEHTAFSPGVYKIATAPAASPPSPAGGPSSAK